MIKKGISLPIPYGVSLNLLPKASVSMLCAEIPKGSQGDHITLSRIGGEKGGFLAGQVSIFMQNQHLKSMAQF